MTRISLQRFHRLGQELGAVGTAALIMLAAAGVFFLLVLQPMKEERARLESVLSKKKDNPTNLSSFYSFLESKDETTDALAKLYAIGNATGVQLQSGNYRTQKETRGTNRLELKKFCRKERKHTAHKESRKK